MESYEGYWDRTGIPEGTLGQDHGLRRVLRRRSRSFKILWAGLEPSDGPLSRSKVP